MKVALTMIFITSSLIFLSNHIFAQNTDPVKDTIVMGVDYTNDVFYGLKNENQTTIKRSNWDIAFRTNIMSSSILTNGGSGVILYTYPKSDTNGWINTDTNGLYSWKAMYNSTKDWEKGAFMANAGSHPDYGWGKYNSTTHKLHGDSIFIIQLPNQTFRKIWIVQKDSPKNKYYVRIANIDGSNDTLIVVNCNNYNTKEFVGYSITNKNIVDREPESGNWDLLFTKYSDKVYMGPSPVDYPVMGILTNDEVYVARVKGKEETTYDDFDVEIFDSNSISTIGRDWKASKGQPPVYSMVDSLLYFISSKDGSIYKLYFNDFISGSAGDGKVMFTKQLLENNSSISYNNQVFSMVLYPNPSVSSAKIIYRTENNAECSVSVYNISGKLVSSDKYFTTQGLNVFELPISNFKSGIYLVNLKEGNVNLSKQLIIK